MTDYSRTNPLVPPQAVAEWLGALPQPVAITGGTGFVGSHVVDTLCAAGVPVRVLVRDPTSPRWIESAPVERIPGSLGEIDALGRLVAGAGTVLHLAGTLRSASERDFDLGNRDGTANLVAAIRGRAQNARLVHVSSLAALGPSADPGGVGPDAEPAPISWYGRSKLAGEREVRRLGDESWWSIVRPPAIYGPRDTDVFEFFRMASRGVVAVPAGERWLTVAWAGDVVRSIIAAAVGRRAGVYHIGAPEPMLLDSLVAELCNAGSVGCRLVRVPQFLVTGAGAAGSALHRFGWHGLPLTADKARELLARHWTARTADSLSALGIDHLTSFPDGAALSWAWYRDRGLLR